MFVTELKPLKKGLYLLCVDGEYTAKLDRLIVERERLCVGDTMDDERLEALTEESNLIRAKEKALYLLEYRARTRKELTDKLIPLFGEDAAENAVQRMEELGLINDEAFAAEYARTLLFSKKLAPDRAVYALMQKGIDKETAQEIIDNIPFDEQEQIRGIIEKKYRRCLDDEKGRQKIINNLRTKGYAWTDIREVLEEYSED